MLQSQENDKFLSTLELLKEAKLDEETLESAKVFNKDNDNNYPFYLKLFEEPKVNENSSIFKVADQEKFVASFARIIEDDSRLAKVTNLNEELKKKAKEEIENLLMTEIEIDQKKREKPKTLSDPRTTSENPFIQKCKDIIELYEKEDERYKAEKSGTSYEKYKQVMTSKAKSFLEKNKKQSTETALRKYQTVVKDSTLKELEDAVVDNTIEFLDLSNKETYHKVELGFLDKASLARLMEIEEKLGSSDLKNTLENCKKVFLTNKESYQKDAEERKDIKPKDPKKIDYLKELRDEKKLKRDIMELDDKLNVFC